MPFTKQEDRQLTLNQPSVALLVPGNRAYIIYRELKRQWNAAPRWTTADRLHHDFVLDPELNEFMETLRLSSPMVGWHELCNAAHLAWQVFFNLVVLPYEKQKMQENGDVE